MLKATVNWLDRFEIWNNAELLASMPKAACIQVADREYVISRTGYFKPRYTLHHGKTLLAEANQKSIFSGTFRIAASGRSWSMKPEGIFSRRAALYSDDITQVGSFVPNSYFYTSEINFDLPYGIPIEVQAFLLWVFLRMLISE